MKDIESIIPDEAYRLWESARDLLPFSFWLPEVVGTASELIRIGSVRIDLTQYPQSEVKQAPLRFIDADVTFYRNMSALFRKRAQEACKK